MPGLERVLAELGGLRPTAATVSHYHFDHSDALPYLKERHGTRSVLHPWVAQPLIGDVKQKVPWNVPEPLKIDELWPEKGKWTWNECKFAVAPLPGQTWWHTGFMTTINGQRVAFTGDTFQPATRWHGTGGFCSYNNSRFADGFIPSARQLLKWKPDICIAGHGTYCAFSPSYYRKVIRWAKRAQQVLTQLCPSGDLEADYYLIPAAQVPNDDEPVHGALYWLK